MRGTILLGLFLVSTLVSCLAGDDWQPGTTPPASPRTRRLSVGMLRSPFLSSPEAQREPLFAPPRQRQERQRVSIRDHVCYSMRSYIVARESPNSDSTRLVGYRTCEPAWKYELRTTVGSVDASR